MQTYPNLTDEQRNALQRFAQAYAAQPGGWKDHLILLWMNGEDAREPDGAALRQVRNTYGPSWLLDDYAVHWRADLPEWTPQANDDTGAPLPADLPRWSNDDPPPNVGATVITTVNNLGEGTVTGYFVEHGFLGLIVRLGDDRPDWHKTQRHGDPVVHLFGAEIKSKAQIEVGRWGFSILPLRHFLNGWFTIRAFQGSPNNTAEEIAAAHAAIKAKLIERARATLARDPSLDAPDAYAVFDPYADEEGWLLVGPKAGIVRETVEFHYDPADDAC